MSLLASESVSSLMIRDWLDHLVAPRDCQAERNRCDRRNVGSCSHSLVPRRMQTRPRSREYWQSLRRMPNFGDSLADDAVWCELLSG